MLFRIAIFLAMLFAVDAYFFNGRHVVAAVEATQHFGTNLNDGISDFTRRLQPGKA